MGWGFCVVGGEVVVGGFFADSSFAVKDGQFFVVHLLVLAGAADVIKGKG